MIAQLLLALLVQDTTLIQGVHIVRGSELLRDQDIVIVADRIVAVTPTTAAPERAGWRVIDAGGRYATAGLIDAHAHLPLANVPAAERLRSMELHVWNGVTTARGMYSDSSHLALRAGIRSGAVLGPDLVLAAPAIQGNVPADIAVRLTDWRRQGYDQAKLIAADADGFATLQRAAAAAALPLTGHVPPQVGLAAAVQGGLKFLEHLDGFLEYLTPGAARPGGFFGLAVSLAADSTRIPQLAALLEESGAVVTPTLQAMHTFADGAGARERPELRYVPAGARRGWPQQLAGFQQNNVTPAAAARFIALRRQIVRALQAADVPILAGSDAVNLFAVPGFALHHELQELVAAGLTPGQALAAATTTPAHAFGLADRGDIAPGKRADLLIVRANPLEDIGHLRATEWLVVRGVPYSESEIAAGLERIAAAQQ